jgi:hypothetical protein
MQRLCINLLQVTRPNLLTKLTTSYHQARSSAQHSRHPQRRHGLRRHGPPWGRRGASAAQLASRGRGAAALPRRGVAIRPRLPLLCHRRCALAPSLPPAAARWWWPLLAALVSPAADPPGLVRRAPALEPPRLALSQLMFRLFIVSLTSMCRVF